MVSPPKAPKKLRVAKQYALDNVRGILFRTKAPSAPRKKQEKKHIPKSVLRNVRQELFPPSPQAPRKRTPPLRRWREADPIPLVWENSFTEEARHLAETGEVRECLLLHTPEDIEEINSIAVLVEYEKLYFPASQPQTEEEEAYFGLLRNCVQMRISLLSQSLM